MDQVSAKIPGISYLARRISFSYLKLHHYSIITQVLCYLLSINTLAKPAAFDNFTPPNISALPRCFPADHPHLQIQNIAVDEIMAAAIPDQPVAAPEPTPAADPEFTPEQLQTRSRDFIAREKFNRRFTLPANDDHGELTVTYAVAGKDSDSAPTILFIGGLYGGRYLATMADYISEKKGVRFVVADR